MRRLVSKKRDVGASLCHLALCHEGVGVLQSNAAAESSQQVTETRHVEGIGRAGAESTQLKRIPEEPAGERHRSARTRKFGDDEGRRDAGKVLFDSTDSLS